MSSRSTPTARQKSAVLWGAVGLLVFLVLHQGYLLAGGEFLGVGRVAVLALFVFVGGAVGSYVTEERLESGSDSEADRPPERRGVGTPAAPGSDGDEEAERAEATTPAGGADADEEDEWMWGGEGADEEASEDQSRDASQ